jgi:hypothetical protein
LRLLIQRARFGFLINEFFVPDDFNACKVRAQHRLCDRFRMVVAAAFGDEITGS